MSKYMISFDDGAMDFPEEEIGAVGDAAHAVIKAAQEAGVWIFGGGIKGQPAIIATTDGDVIEGPYPENKAIIGGFVILDVDSLDEASTWATKIASACRCNQEIREIMLDPRA